MSKSSSALYGTWRLRRSASSTWSCTGVERESVLARHRDEALADLREILAEIAHRDAGELIHAEARKQPWSGSKTPITSYSRPFSRTFLPIGST